MRQTTIPPPIFYMSTLIRTTGETRHAMSTQSHACTVVCQWAPRRASGFTTAIPLDDSIKTVPLWLRVRASSPSPAGDERRLWRGGYLRNDVLFEPRGHGGIGRDVTVFAAEGAHHQHQGRKTDANTPCSFVPPQRETVICELNFMSKVLDLHLNRIRLVVVLEDRIHLYDIASMKLLHTIDTPTNQSGTRDLNVCRSPFMRNRAQSRMTAHQACPHSLPTRTSAVSPIPPTATPGS